MKKFTLFLTVILMVLLVVSCNQNDISGSVTIKPHVFSDETNKAIKYLDGVLKLWDVKVSDEIKSYDITVLRCKNGKWQKRSVSDFEVRDTNVFKIGLSYRGNKYSIIEVNKNGESIIELGEPISFSDMSWGESAVSTKVNVEKGKEVVLYSKIGYKKGKDNYSINPSDYENSNCDTGFVIIATFSDKKADEKRGE